MPTARSEVDTVERLREVEDSISGDDRQNAKPASLLRWGLMYFLSSSETRVAAELQLTEYAVTRESMSRLSMTLTVAALLPLQVQADDLSQQNARKALRATVNSYRTLVGYQGAYLWRYSADLKLQEGEGRATKTSGWTQPPGTPSVGEAFLKSWRLSGDETCLEAAVECANALVRSQLNSGGWSSHFDLGQPGRKKYSYRVDGQAAGTRNHTTFDDNKSQSALMLLMHVDEALGFKHETIHEAVEYALSHILASQYPNGAWPQQFAEPTDPSKYTVRKASYPESWSRTYPQKDYRGYYTLNDNNMSYIIDMLFEAYRIYDRQDCHAAAKKTGEFFLLAQMPEPQPGWAQQYDSEMHPAWARKFEPASVTGGESQSVMRTLLRVYQFTGDKKFIEPLPRALNYYRKSMLPDGRLARFYELRTNRPLYFTKDYKLTYSSADMPTHYGFIVGSKLDSIESEFNRVKSLPANQLKPTHRPPKPSRLTKKVRSRAASILKQQDARRLWVEDGELRTEDGVSQVIRMETLIRNLPVLAEYVGAVD